MIQMAAQLLAKLIPSVKEADLTAFGFEANYTNGCMDALVLLVFQQ